MQSTQNNSSTSTSTALAQAESDIDLGKAAVNTLRGAGKALAVTALAGFEGLDSFNRSFAELNQQLAIERENRAQQKELEKIQYQSEHLIEFHDIMTKLFHLVRNKDDAEFIDSMIAAYKDNPSTALSIAAKRLETKEELQRSYQKLANDLQQRLNLDKGLMARCGTELAELYMRGFMFKDNSFRIFVDRLGQYPEDMTSELISRELRKYI